MLFGMANGVLTLARATAVADLYGADHYGSLSGVMAFWTTLARAAGPTMVALVYTASQRYEPTFMLLATAMTLAALAYLLAERQWFLEHKSKPAASTIWP